jgi:hypothetical protein
VTWFFVSYSVPVAYSDGTARISTEKRIVTCLDVLENLATRIGADPTVKSEYDLKNTVHPTVKIVGEQTGLHGGKRIKIERLGETWGSSARSHAYDPQGDPRFFALIVGYEAAEFFGFKMLSVTQMLVPDVAELNGAIKSMNALLQQRKYFGLGHAQGEAIPVTYYAQVKPNLPKYLTEWSKNAKLPIGEGNEYFHDISFHSGAIFLPPVAVLHSQNIAAHVSDFIEYLKMNLSHLEGESLRALKRYIYFLRLEESLTIDFHTGVLADALADFNAFKRAEASNRDFVSKFGSYRRSLKNITESIAGGVSLTPRTFLKKNVLNLLEDPRHSLEHQKSDDVNLWNHLPKSKIELLFTAYDDRAIDYNQQYVAWINIESVQSGNLQNLGSYIAPAAPSRMDLLCQLIMRRREIISKIAREYCQKNANIFGKPVTIMAASRSAM